MNVSFVKNKILIRYESD